MYGNLYLAQAIIADEDTLLDRPLLDECPVLVGRQPNII